MYCIMDEAQKRMAACLGEGVSIRAVDGIYMFLVDFIKCLRHIGLS